ncbi:deoxyribonuclease IV [Bacillus sp. V59.32b]|uniref:deoxyribonuclease IV n=1 Tax=Bacillus sp. V59.32b TaxID=1758642 RepID=UPI000E3BA597|nr:deoxyribonuclease IV [Bacillus sp. V59.32b]RFU66548.1 deoxyribonuclease IV [Bacillus sp. V59.32b]
MKFGCHVSIREGYLGAAKHTAALNASAFQYFPKNPRSLTVKKFDKIDAASCREYCQQHSLTSIAHTPYPTSLTPSHDKREAVIESLINDLEIAEACGSVGIVVHFGSQISSHDPLASYQLMIEVLNDVTSKWEGVCKILLENNAGKPGSIGTTFEELVQVRNLCENPLKIGFCLDTCHAFASGLWDGDNWEALAVKGQELSYFKELYAIHFNNSKFQSGLGKDRHANIFKGGHIKKKQFEELINSPVLKEVPFILETPSKEGITHKDEIEQLQHTWG